MIDGNPPSFPGDDEELVFDDLDIADAPAPVPAAELVQAPQPEDTGKPRRAPRKGRRTEDATIVEAPVADAPAPSESADAAEPVAEADEPAGKAPAPFPPLANQPAGSNSPRLLLAIVCLALLTSLFSLGGLIAVSRTLARAGVAREEAIAERDALRRVPQLVQHLDDASAKLDTAAAKLSAASPNGPAASVADIQHQLDALRLALDAHQPQGVDALNSMTRAGFSEVATRLDRIQSRLGVQPGRGPKPGQDDAD